MGDLTIIDAGDLREEEVKKQSAVKQVAVPRDSGDTFLGEWELLIVGED